MTVMPESTEVAGDPSGATAVEVSAVVPQSVERVWQLMTTQEGIEALLGPGATLGGKGEPWHCVDGSHGVVRSYHPMEQVRVSWHADEHAPSSLVELDLQPDGDGTRVDLRHEHLPDAAAAASLRTRWAGALERLAAAAG